MGNILIPDASVIKAINDGGALVFDHNLKPISSKEIAKPGKKRTHKISMPVGGGWIYFKHNPKGDQWYVGRVYKRSIPQGINAFALDESTAFKMIYGERVHSMVDKHTWEKISDTEVGEVVVEYEEELYSNLPNPNSEGVYETICKEAEGNFK